MTRPWEEHQPSPEWLLECLIAMAVGMVAVSAVVSRNYSLNALLSECGVRASRVKRAADEIERKSFHICGLLVPAIHLLLLEAGVTNSTCVRICWTITIGGWLADLARLNIPIVARNWPGRSILRAKEHAQLTGGCFFSLGCTLSIALSPPSVAMVSILFLVLGDLSAAIIGVSFGGEKVSLKLGREGKKSLEGSLAMFAVCMTVGCIIFAGVELREYGVFVGALIATLTELHEPLGLNDNLTIPLFSAIAMQWGLGRVRSCASPSTLPPPQSLFTALGGALGI